MHRAECHLGLSGEVFFTQLDLMDIISLTNKNVTMSSTPPLMLNKPQLDLVDDTIVIRNEFIVQVGAHS